MSTKNYWVSWRASTNIMEDFEMHSPWWVTGSGDGYVNVCAALKAHGGLEDIQAQIMNCYGATNPNLEMRFCEERPDGWAPWDAPGSRFQRADWMVWK